MTFLPSSVVINDEDFRVFKDAEGNIYPVKSIDQYILFRVGILERNLCKIIDPSALGIQSPLRIESVYADEPENDRFSLTILTPESNPVALRTFEKSSTPYKFPDFILDTGFKLKICSLSTTVLEKMFVFCTPVHLIAKYDI